MIQVIPGDTGEGKTKTLISLANETLDQKNGHIVYIDVDDSHIYDLKHQIRYINISEFPIDDYHEFYGFLCGILSEDRDIDFVFVDGLLKMAHLEQIKASDSLVEKVRVLTDKFDVKLITSINCDEETLPEFLHHFSA